MLQRLEGGIKVILVQLEGLEFCGVAFKMGWRLWLEVSREVNLRILRRLQSPEYFEGPTLGGVAVSVLEHCI